MMPFPSGAGWKFLMGWNWELFLMAEDVPKPAKSDAAIDAKWEKLH